jgi:Spy/CpxP family protein refolding chaperone
MDRDRRARRGLFNGIELTSAQRSRIDSIRTNYRAQMKPLLDEMRPAMQEARAARRSGDSAKVKTARENMTASRQKMQALRKQQTAQIRGVLTPEQRQKFDANVTRSTQDRRGQARQHRGASRDTSAIRQ